MLDIYRAYVKVALAVELEHRVASLLYQIGAVLSPLVYLSIWGAVARVNGGSVGGRSQADFAAYYLALMLISRAASTWILWEYEYRVRDGTLSAALLRPVHPIHKDIADNLTHNALMLAALTPVAAALAISLDAVPSPQPWAVAALVPALLLTIALRFAIEWTIAIAAFWTTRSGALSRVYFAALLFCSGQAAPLDMLPGPLQWLAGLLPFRWVVAFPVELALGQLTPEAALSGMAAQLLWLALAALLLRTIWRVGLRRYGAVGA